MKMIKRLVLILALLIILALPVCAETAGDPLIDDFNSFTADESRLSTGYPKNSTESAVFEYSSTYSKNYGASKIQTGAGPDGSTALVVGNKGSDISLMTIGLNTADSSTVYEISYDIKFNNNTTDKILAGNSRFGVSYPLFEFRKDGKFYVNTNPSAYVFEEAGTYQADEWFKVIIIRKGSVKYGYLIDSDGNTYYSRRDETGSSISVLYMKASAASTTTGTIDNAKIISYIITENVPSLLSSSVEDDADGVQRNKAFTFVFDQEISDDSVVTLTKKDGTELVGVTDIETEKTFYNTLTFSYTGLLERKTEYVLSFADVSNGELTCLEEISFTTEDLHLWNDVLVSSLEVNEDDATLTDITFTIGDEYGYSSFSGSVMAVVYQGGKMIGVDIQTLTNADTGELTVSFDLETLPTEYEIGIILLDMEDGPIPLAGGMLEN